MPPCVIERWGAERGGATDQSATSSEACSVVTPVHRKVDKEEPSLSPKGEGHGSTWDLGAGAKNLPAQGAWNGQRVVLGTGEILLGPGSAARVAVLSITGDPGSGRRPRGSRRGS